MVIYLITFFRIIFFNLIFFIDNVFLIILVSRFMLEKSFPEKRKTPASIYRDAWLSLFGAIFNCIKWSEENRGTYNGGIAPVFHFFPSVKKRIKGALFSDMHVSLLRRICEKTYLMESGWEIVRNQWSQKPTKSICKFKKGKFQFTTFKKLF